MDKTPEYMEMCAKAAPLQHSWQQARGDVYTTDMKTVRCWLPERPAVHELRRGYGIIRNAEIVQISRLVWLPRLDQLMVIAQSPQASFDRTSQAFFDWCVKDQPPWGPPKKRFRSLEQMWLAFVMLRRFRLKWADADGWQPAGAKGLGGKEPRRS